MYSTRPTKDVLEYWENMPVVPLEEHPGFIGGIALRAASVPMREDIVRSTENVLAIVNVFAAIIAGASTELQIYFGSPWPSILKHPVVDTALALFLGTSEKPGGRLRLIVSDQACDLGFHAGGTMPGGVWKPLARKPEDVPPPLRFIVSDSNMYWYNYFGADATDVRGMYCFKSPVTVGNLRRQFEEQWKFP